MPIIAGDIFLWIAIGGAVLFLAALFYATIQEAISDRRP